MRLLLVLQLLAAAPLAPAARWLGFFRRQLGRRGRGLFRALMPREVSRVFGVLPHLLALTRVLYPALAAFFEHIAALPLTAQLIDALKRSRAMRKRDFLRLLRSPRRFLARLPPAQAAGEASAEDGEREQLDFLAFFQREEVGRLREALPHLREIAAAYFPAVGVFLDLLGGLAGEQKASTALEDFKALGWDDLRAALRDPAAFFAPQSVKALTWR